MNFDKTTYLYLNHSENRSFRSMEQQSMDSATSLRCVQNDGAGTLLIRNAESMKLQKPLHSQQNSSFLRGQNISGSYSSILGLFLFTLCLLLPSFAQALPLYGAREGRTCDNCHTLPNTWKNPENVKDRKCSLSCVVCHIDPTGGGLRNVSGRFYGQSTLSMGYATYRGYKDSIRFLTPGLKATEKVRGNYLPELAFGKPLGGPSKMAWDQSRYAGLNADPLVLAGLDVRLAGWIPGGAVLVFPMQFDTSLALHPVEHVTGYVNAGVLAKSKGFAETFERQTPYAVKDAFVMLHELPYMSYAKVGRFAPPFGTRLDDHTSYIRRDFELDLGLQESRVFGAEIGMAPNYPYLNVAVFRPNQKDLFSGADPTNDVQPPFTGVDGIGAAASAGYRELGWQVGASAMVRERALVDGGNTTSLSVQWGVNPWFYDDKKPFTYLGEIAGGIFQREGSGSEAKQYAIYQELDYTPYNGVNLRLKYDFHDPDLDLIDDHETRFSLSTDITIAPGVRLSAMGRLGLVAGTKGEGIADGFVYLKGWL